MSGVGSKSHVSPVEQAVQKCLYGWIDHNNYQLYEYYVS